MAGDEEVEAVEQAILKFGDSYGIPHGSGSRAMAEACVAALDRVRSRPAGGTEGEDHEAERLRDPAFLRDALAREMAEVARLTGDLHRAQAKLKGATEFDGIYPSPAGGTRPEDHEAGMKAAVEAVADILDSYEYTKSVDALVLVEAVMSRASDAQLRDELVSLGETNHAIVQANGRLLAERDEALARVREVEAEQEAGPDGR